MAEAALVVLASLAALYLVLFVIGRVRRKDAPKRAVLTGGGSAGHVYPAIAIGKALTPEVSEFLYLGTRRRAEEKVVPKEGIPIKFIPAAPYPGLSPWLPFFAVKLFLGIVESCFHLYFFQPKYVIGTGGFVSAPVVMAAFKLNCVGLLRCRIYLHEQNVAPGKLNLLAGRFARKVMVTFPESLVFFRKNGILTGYPLRATIIKEAPEVARKKLPFPDPGKRTLIFAFGGSQGSRTINRAVVDSLRFLLPLKDNIFVVLSAGLGQTVYRGIDDVRGRLAANYTEAERREIDKFFHCDTYFHNVSSIFSAASLVISRSGAGSLFELASMGEPSVLIPKFGLAGEHQVMNAQAMERVGGAFIFYEKPMKEDGRITEGVEGREIAGKIISLVGAPDILAGMRQGAEKLLPPADPLEAVKMVVIEDRLPEGVKGTPFRPVKSVPDFIAEVGAVRAREGRKFSMDRAFQQPELDYYRAKALSLLYQEDWRLKNLGVKLAGLLKLKQSAERLLELAVSRKEAPLWERAFGADFEEVGFVRRNCFVSLTAIGEWGDEWEDAAALGLSDPYYEVRVEALKMSVANSRKLKDAGRFTALARGLLADREFEVVKEAVILLGEIGSEEQMPDLFSLSEHFFWQVREAALLALRRMVERKVPCDLGKLREEASKFVLTSTDFRPTFGIKENYRDLMKALGAE